MLQNTFGVHEDYVYNALNQLVRKTQFNDLYSQDNKFSLPEDGNYPLPGNDAGKAWAEDTLYQYLPAGQVLQVTNGLGQVTSYAYDAANRLIQTTDLNVLQADGSTTYLVTTYKYDEDNNRTEQADLRDPGEPAIVQQFTYDGLNHLVQTEIVSGPSTPLAEVTMQATYDLMGNLLCSMDLHGDTTYNTYDWLFQLVKLELPVRDASGNPAVIETTYDQVGNKVMQTDANGNPTYYKYDSVYRLTLQTDALGNKIAYQ